MVYRTAFILFLLIASTFFTARTCQGAASSYAGSLRNDHHSASHVINLPRLTGEGVRIALLDTAVASLYPNRSGAPALRCGSEDGESCFGDGTPHGIEISHGTRTLSVMAGNVTEVGPGGRRYLGIAPRARVTLFPVLEEAAGGAKRRGTPADTLMALETVLDMVSRVEPMGDPVALPFHILCLPLGFIPDPEEAFWEENERRTSTALSDVRRIQEVLCEIAASGVVVIAAAGNTGPLFHTLSPVPASLSCVITVGEVLRRGETYETAVTSSRGTPFFATATRGASSPPGIENPGDPLPFRFTFDHGKPDVWSGQTKSGDGSSIVQGVSLNNGSLLLSPPHPGSSHATAVVSGLVALLAEAIMRETERVPVLKARSQLRRRFLNTPFVKAMLRRHASHRTGGSPARCDVFCNSSNPAVQSFFTFLEKGMHGGGLEPSTLPVCTEATDLLEHALEHVHRHVALPRVDVTPAAGIDAFAIPDIIDVRTLRRRATNISSRAPCDAWWPQCEQPLRKGAPPRVFPILIHTTLCRKAVLARNESTENRGVVRHVLERATFFREDGHSEEVLQGSALDSAQNTQGGFLRLSLFYGSSTSLNAFTAELVVMAEASVTLHLPRHCSHVDVEGFMEVPYQCEHDGWVDTAEDTVRLTARVRFAFTIENDVPQDKFPPAQRLLVDSTGLSLSTPAQVSGFVQSYLYLTHILGFQVDVFPVRAWYEHISDSEATRMMGRYETTVLAGTKEDFAQTSLNRMGMRSSFMETVLYAVRNRGHKIVVVGISDDMHQGPENCDLAHSIVTVPVDHCVAHNRKRPERVIARYAHSPAAHDNFFASVLRAFDEDSLSELCRAPLRHVGHGHANDNVPLAAFTKVRHHSPTCSSTSHASCSLSEGRVALLSPGITQCLLYPTVPTLEPDNPAAAFLYNRESYRRAPPALAEYFVEQAVGHGENCVELWKETMNSLLRPPEGVLWWRDHFDCAGSGAQGTTAFAQTTVVPAAAQRDETLLTHYSGTCPRPSTSPVSGVLSSSFLSPTMTACITVALGVLLCRFLLHMVSTAASR